MQKCVLNVGKNQKNFFQKHIILTIILVLIILGSIGAGLNTNNFTTTNTPSTSSTESSTKINLEKFNQIQSGMTYEQVVEIIGEEGTVMSNVDIGNEEYQTTMYYWYGEDGISNANVTIQGGKVVSKAQIGLK